MFKKGISNGFKLVLYFNLLVATLFGQTATDQIPLLLRPVVIMQLQVNS